MTDESREPEIPPPRRRFGCLSWSLTIGGGVIVTVFGLTAFLYWLVYLEGRGLEMRVVNMTKDAVRIEKVLFGENELELRGDLTASDQSNTNWSRFISESMNYEGAVPVFRLDDRKTVPISLGRRYLAFQRGVLCFDENSPVGSFDHPLPRTALVSGPSMIGTDHF